MLLFKLAAAIHIYLGAASDRTAVPVPVPVEGRFRSRARPEIVWPQQ